MSRLETTIVAATRDNNTGSAASAVRAAAAHRANGVGTAARLVHLDHEAERA